VKKKNIATNAKIHKMNPLLLKMDFKDFFPSIKSHDFKNFVMNSNCIETYDDEIDILTNTLFWKQKNTSILQLSIGAPTSPYLSNILMFEFDKKVYEICNNENVAYSRYADDLTFSTQSKQARSRVYDAVLEVVKLLKFPRLKVNNRKTLFASKSNRRRVCGLIITPEQNISIGRQNKRKISSMVHLFTLNRLDPQKVKKLKGLLAYASDMEIDFVKRLESKYGMDVIRKIKSVVIV
jgi:retron-type reverse transcriptase